MPKLTDKQDRFCEQYLADIEGTGTEAYQVVYGCSKKAAATGAARLLAKPHIQKRIEELREETVERTAITRASVLELVRDRAYADITDVIDFGPTGIVLKSSKTLPKSVTRGIQSIKITSNDNGETVSVTMRSSDAALKILSNFFGLETGIDALREGLKRFGIALLEDATQPTGFQLEQHIED